MFIVLRGDPEPRFEDWSVDFDFGAAPPAESGARSPALIVAAAGLPPAIQADLHLRKSEQALREGDTETAREALERVASLQSGHGLELAAEDHTATRRLGQRRASRSGLWRRRCATCRREAGTRGITMKRWT